MDRHLDRVIQHLIKHWYDSDVGIVAAAIIDGKNEAFATSIRKGGYWYHAERNASDLFKQKFGLPGADAVIISTLSPCISELKYRKEPSCCELISNLGINKIHFGVLDTLHATTNEAYEKLGFEATCTKDEKLHRICTKLMDLFTHYESRINTDLIGIKKELSDLFFKV